jgi:beta-glucanase (GH16 family)
MRRDRSPTVTALTVILLGVAAFSGPAPATGHPPPDWQVVWRDDFDGDRGSLPSPDDWIVDTGTGYPGGPSSWGTGEVQAYTADPSTIALDGRGNLAITPRRDGAGNWTSARVETRRSDFTAPEGGVLRVEGRLRMPDVTGDAGLGYWPAFWALGAPYRGDHWNWPQVGEIDVAENVNGVDRVWGVLHCGTPTGGSCDEPTGRAATTACPGSPCRSDFHTYRLEWDRAVTPDQLRWYVDEQRFHAVSAADVDPDAWAAMTTHAGFFLLLDVAVGGGFPDAVAGLDTPTAATVPGVPMVVDHVSVSTKAGR